MSTHCKPGKELHETSAQTKVYTVYGTIFIVISMSEKEFTHTNIPHQTTVYIIL